MMIYIYLMNKIYINPIFFILLYILRIMTIEFGYLFNDVCQTTSNTWFGFLFSNVVYTSILLSLIILIIICFTYPVKKNTPFYITIKLIFYVFIAVLGILAIHNSIIESKLEDSYSSKMNKEILKVVGGRDDIITLLGPDKNIKIVPKYKPITNENIYKEVKQPSQEIDSEEILNQVIKRGTSEEPKDKQENLDNHIKVVGASVDDMLTELGV